LAGLVTAQLVVPNEHTVVSLGLMDTADEWLALIGILVIGSLIYHQIFGSLLLGLLVYYFIDVFILLDKYFIKVP
jgi:xanthine/uracil/vitamin C permease (AzgA family)